MTNTETFEKLTPEIQDQLLEIAINNTARELKLLSNNQFILSEDLDDNVGDMKDDTVLEAAKEICRYSSSYSKDMFEAIQNDLKLDVDDIQELIDSHLNGKQMSELFELYESFSNNSNDMKVTSIDEEWRIGILKQLFDKYTSYQLEEKVKHLI